MRTRLAAVVAFVLVIVLAGCVNDRSIPFTEQEVDDYIADQNFDTLAVEFINEDFVVVLYQQGSVTGFHMLYKDHEGNIQDPSVHGYDSGSAPVQLSGSATKYPFVTVIVNDDSMMERADRIEVTFEDGRVVRRKFMGRGAIIPYGTEIEGSMSSSSVVLYDAENREVYAYPS